MGVPCDVPAKVLSSLPVLLEPRPEPSTWPPAPSPPQPRVPSCPGHSPLSGPSSLPLLLGKPHHCLPQGLGTCCSLSDTLFLHSTSPSPFRSQFQVLTRSVLLKVTQTSGISRTLWNRLNNTSSLCPRAVVYKDGKTGRVRAQGKASSRHYQQNESLPCV